MSNNKSEKQENKTYALSSVTSSSSKNGFSLLKSYFRPYYKSLTIILVMLFITTTISLFIPMGVRRIIDVNLSSNPPDLLGLRNTVIVIIIFALIAVSTLYMQIRRTGELGQTVLFNIRRDLFAKLQELPLRFYSQNTSGDIIARLTSDVESISRFLSEGIIRGLGFVFNLIIILVIMFSLNIKLTLIILAVFILMLVIFAIQSRFLRTALKKSLDKDGLISSEIQEILNGFRIIKSFGKEELMLKRFTSSNSEYFKYAMRANIIDAITGPFINFLSAFTTLVVIIIGLLDVSNGYLSKGSLLAYIVYVGAFFGPIRNAGGLWKTIQGGIASSQRIYDILNLKTNIIEIHSPYNPNKNQIRGKVEFINVSFGYDNKSLVLDNINFTINASETIAIVGPTGGGKTTFVNLIARLYDTNEGEVLIDDVNVKDWKLENLRNLIGYLLQDTFLFEDTIFNNLKYNNPNISKKQALNILNSIGAGEFIDNLPDGINFQLKANGSNISAGQRQILAIARLLLKDPKILVLDEATSNIDTKTEELIQKAIDKSTKGRTSIIIAHRLSTIKNADRIVLISNNRILESGTHSELMNAKGYFYEMYSRFSS